MITLTADQLESLLTTARRELVAKLISGHREEITLISPAQAAGLLDVTVNTLSSLHIPRVVIVPHRVVKYRLADIRAFITENLEK